MKIFQPYFSEGILWGKAIEQLHSILYIYKKCMLKTV